MNEKRMNGDKEFLLSGSGRIKRLSEPLRAVSTVSMDQEIFDKAYSKMAKIHALNSYIQKHDCIVITDILGEKALLVGELCKRHNVPFIVRPRGGMCGEFADRRHHLPYWKRKISVTKKRAIRNKVLQRADGIVPVSHFLKNQILYSNLASPQNIEVAYEPYDSALPGASKSGRFKDYLELDGNDLILLSVTSFNYEKKYSGIVDYAPIIDSIIQNNDDLHYAIVGGGQYARKAEDEIRDQFSSETQNQLHFPGYYESIEEVYTDSDIFTHLSYRDSLGMTVVEAELFSLPVIVNYGGGMSELLPKANKGNSVIRTNDELFRALKQLTQCSTQRQKTGQKNHSWVQDKFNPESIGYDITESVRMLL